MKLLPGFTAEVSLVRRESPYYVSKEHTFSDEVIPLQMPPNMPPSPEPDIRGFTFTRNPRACIPTFSPTCLKWIRIRDNYAHISEICSAWGFEYKGVVCS